MVFWGYVLLKGNRARSKGKKKKNIFHRDSAKVRLSLQYLMRTKLQKSNWTWSRYFMFPYRYLSHSSTHTRKAVVIFVLHQICYTNPPSLVTREQQATQVKAFLEELQHFHIIILHLHSLTDWELTLFRGHLGEENSLCKSNSIGGTTLSCLVAQG